MNWPIVIGVGVVLVAFFVLKRLSLVSAEVVRKHLAEGALVIDVRSSEEFHNRHIPEAINIPLGELHDALPRRVKDKSQVLLLHCLSGGRSAIAKARVKGMGYPNAFNLGSYSRAEQLVGGLRRK